MIRDACPQDLKNWLEVNMGFDFEGESELQLLCHILENTRNLMKRTHKHDGSFFHLHHRTRALATMWLPRNVQTKEVLSLCGTFKLSNERTLVGATDVHHG